MKNSKIFELIKEKEHKYSELVWYARSLKNLHFHGVIENRNRIEKSHPNEIMNLKNTDTSDWHHGFNSGMLASTRYILSLKEYGKELADEEFPDLVS